MSETRADAKPTFDKIWPGARVSQVMPLTSESATTRAGIAIVVRPRGKELIEGR